MRDFVKFHRISPDQLWLDHIYEYQVIWTLLNRERFTTEGHLRHPAGTFGTLRAPSALCYFNQSVCAIRFFYKITLNKDWDIKHIPFQKKGITLPTVLSKEEIVALFNAINNIKHRALILTIYSAGLRLQETLNLKPTDIDSKRMVIHVKNGKGKKDRYIMLSPKTPWSLTSLLEST